MAFPLAGLLPLAGSFGGGQLARLLLSKLLPNLAKKTGVSLAADVLGGGAAYMGIEHLLNAGKPVEEGPQDNIDGLNQLEAAGAAMPSDNDLELIKLMQSSNPEQLGLV